MATTHALTLAATGLLGAAAARAEAPPPPVADVWDRAPFHYTLETTLATTRVWGDGERDVFTVRPGIFWEVPPRFTFRARGQWLLGVGLRATEGPDGSDFGATAKLRVNFDFKRLWRELTGKAP